jgi:hypothetical protein
MSRKDSKIVNEINNIKMELKQEITEIVNTLPNDVLGELLLYLRQVEKVSQEQMRLSLNLKTILTEDRELLERLAK